MGRSQKSSSEIPVALQVWLGPREKNCLPSSGPNIWKRKQGVHRRNQSWCLAHRLCRSHLARRLEERHQLCHVRVVGDARTSEEAEGTNARRPSASRRSASHSRGSRCQSRGSNCDKDRSPSQEAQEGKSSDICASRIRCQSRCRSRGSSRQSRIQCKECMSPRLPRLRAKGIQCKNRFMDFCES